MVRPLNGFVQLARSLANTDLWLCDKFTRGQAFVDLIMLARERDGEIILNNRHVALRRGQVAHSLRGLGQRWQWSLDKVSAYLRWLESEERITVQATHVVTILTLTNYNLYQQPNSHQDSIPDTAPDSIPDTEQDAVPDSDPDANQDRKGKGKGNSTQKPFQNLVEIPSEAEVSEHARAWPGDPSRGIQPGIPEAWWLSWYAHALKEPTPGFARNWRGIMVARFKADWVANRFGARAGVAGPAGAAPEETGTKLLWKLKSQLAECEATLKDHPGNPAYQVEIDDEAEESFLRLEAKAAALRSRIAQLASEV